MPYSIMIDAGHGGNDPGAVYKGSREKDDNFALAMEVGRILWIFLSLFTGTAALR